MLELQLFIFVMGPITVILALVWIFIVLILVAMDYAERNKFSFFLRFVAPVIAILFFLFLISYIIVA
jgi:hypothetical protein